MSEPTDNRPVIEGWIQLDLLVQILGAYRYWTNADLRALFRSHLIRRVREVRALKAGDRFVMYGKYGEMDELIATPADAKNPELYVILDPPSGEEGYETMFFPTGEKRVPRWAEYWEHPKTGEIATQGRYNPLLGPVWIYERVSVKVSREEQEGE